MRSGFLQFASVATWGFTKVVVPVLVFAGEPANRSAFSHPTTPPQLSMNLLPTIRRWMPYSAAGSPVAPGFGQVDGRRRETVSPRPFTSPLRRNVLAEISAL